MWRAGAWLRGPPAGALPNADPTPPAHLLPLGGTSPSPPFSPPPCDRLCGRAAIFARSLIISYAALYCLVGMVVTLLGLMHALHIPLGITAALALSLVIGMSVDYIIHISCAPPRNPPFCVAMAPP